MSQGKPQTAQFNVVDGMRHARSCPYLWTPRGTCDCHPLDEAKAMRAPDLLSIFKPLPQDEADALREYLDDMSSKDEATLKPCPFCGGQATLLEVEKRETHDAMVECIRCETTGPTSETEAEAIAAWNRRTGWADEIERLRAEVADLKLRVIAFGGPHMVAWAQDHGLPKGHLYADHYDILKRCGARMDDFTRADL